MLRGAHIVLEKTHILFRLYGNRIGAQEPKSKCATQQPSFSKQPLSGNHAGMPSDLDVSVPGTRACTCAWGDPVSHGQNTF